MGDQFFEGSELRRSSSPTQQDARMLGFGTPRPGTGPGEANRQENPFLALPFVQLEAVLSQLAEGSNSLSSRSPDFSAQSIRRRST